MDGARWLSLGAGRFALVDEDVFESVKGFKWYLGAGRAGRPESRYAVRSQPTGVMPHLVYLHRNIASAPAGVEVDHINENKLDNRRANLRVCTSRQNIINKAKVRARSGYRGVFPSGAGWFARIHNHMRPEYLGFFMSAEDAARAYDAAARRIQGAFAVLNFPEPGERGAMRADRPPENKAA